MRRPAGRGLVGALLLAAGALIAICADLADDSGQLPLGLLILGCGWLAWRAWSLGV